MPLDFTFREFVRARVQALGAPDWVITNPPFMVSRQFALQALEVAGAGVALLCRSAWGEGEERYRDLFSRRPPTAVYQFCERVPMVRGGVYKHIPDGKGGWKKTSSATAYSWFVWDFAEECVPSWERCTAYRWIPPGTRARLERETDFDPYPVELLQGGLL